MSIEFVREDFFMVICLIMMRFEEVEHLTFGVPTLTPMFPLKFENKEFLFPLNLTIMFKT